MNAAVSELVVNGVVYVPKGAALPEVKGDYCIVRTHSAGVFAGIVVKREGMEVAMSNARRLWYWDGAASLSQLAMEGVKAPANCKFAMPVTSLTVTQAIEIIPATETARANIEGVPNMEEVETKSYGYGYGYGDG